MDNFTLSRNVAGRSLIGIAFWLIVFGIFGLVGFKLAPPYMEHNAVKSSLLSLSKEKNVHLMGKSKIQELLYRRFQVNSITGPSHKDLVIDKRADGTHLSLEYEVRVPVIGNIDAVVVFKDSVVVTE